VIVARPRHPLRTALLAALAVLAIAVGLVSIQTFSEGTAIAQSGGVSAQSASVGAHHSAPDATVVANAGLLDNCVGDLCGMGCVMLGMMCLLGLLTAVLTMIFRRGRPPLAAIEQAERAIRLVARRLVEPAPPSLHVLSVCRT